MTDLRTFKAFMAVYRDLGRFGLLPDEDVGRFWDEFVAARAPPAQPVKRPADKGEDPYAGLWPIE